MSYCVLQQHSCCVLLCTVTVPSCYAHFCVFYLHAMHTFVHFNNFMLCPFVYFSSIFMISAASYILTVSSGCAPICERRDSSVGIATRHGLDGPWIESRWGGEIVHTRRDRPWGPPSLLYNGYRVFPGGKAAGAWR